MVAVPSQDGSQDPAYRLAMDFMQKAPTGAFSFFHTDCFGYFFRDNLVTAALGCDPCCMFWLISSSAFAV